MNPFFPTFQAIWLPLFLVILLVSQAIFSLIRKNVPGAIQFGLSCIFAALWMTGGMLESLFSDIPAKIFVIKMQAVFLLPAATSITCFILEYTWPGRMMKPRNIFLLSIMPVVCILLILTDHIHHLIWVGFLVDGTTIIPQKNPIMWFFIIYGCALGIANFILFVWLFFRSKQHRWPVVIMLIGQIVARVVFVLSSLRTVYVNYPLEQLGVGFVFVAYAIALFAFEIFDPIPLAFQTAFEQLQGGIVVVDTKGRFVSMNPAAEHILNLTIVQLKGKTVKEIIPDYPDGYLPSAIGTEIEFRLNHRLYFVMTVSPLRDWRGMEVGRLLLLRDITRLKESQNMIIEQQRSLAKLQEREILARELHDSIGQVLGYVSLQGQAIAKWLSEGDIDASKIQLDRLINVAQDAHVDLRDSILSLRFDAPSDWSFLSAIRNYAEAYQSNYGISTEFVIEDGLVEDDFATGCGVQLVRAVQEALTNARKHAHAKHVSILMQGEGKCATILVIDDGDGFDPTGQEKSAQGHFGLVFMKERLDQIGGSLEIDSAPGEGTRIKMMVPLCEKG